MIACVSQLRFLLPVLPLFNLAAAAALVRAIHNRSKSTQHRLACAAAVALMLASLSAAMFMLYVSAHNYPGGQALHQLHQQAAPRGAWQAPNSGHEQLPVSVHISVLPAMTGVSRFLELDPPWQYSKVRLIAYLPCWIIQ